MKEFRTSHSYTAEDAHWVEIKIRRGDLKNLSGFLGRLLAGNPFDQDAIRYAEQFRKAISRTL